MTKTTLTMKFTPFPAFLSGFVLVCWALFAQVTSSFVVIRPNDGAHLSQSSLIVLHEQNNNNGGLFQGVSNFFQELDAFMDDASARRLGNGAAFYGKRKSNFYGANDKQKKADRDMPDPTEDYQGPTNTGLFKWIQDEETGQMKPVTRMKNKVIERNPKFWDRFYENNPQE